MIKLLKAVERQGYYYNWYGTDFELELMYTVKSGWRYKSRANELWWHIDPEDLVEFSEHKEQLINQLTANIAEHAALTYLNSSNLVGEETIQNYIDGWRELEVTLKAKVDELLGPNLTAIDGGKGGSGQKENGK